MGFLLGLMEINLGSFKYGKMDGKVLLIGRMVIST